MADKSKLIDINGLKTFKSNYDVEIDEKIAQGGGGVSPEQKAIWDAKYDKPEGGIPSTDLASDVQSSLSKADTALQSFTEEDPTVPNHVKNISETDINNWDAKAEMSDIPDVPTWAMQPNKPTYTANEVGALSSTTAIPKSTSDLTNDSNFIALAADDTYVELEVDSE